MQHMQNDLLSLMHTQILGYYILYGMFNILVVSNKGLFESPICAHPSVLMHFLSSP